MKSMPMLFVGHGSPMNAIEENQFSEQWKQLGKQIARPKAILSISAHWYTQGSRVTDAPEPKMVYDMYGFPDELYRVLYNPPGSPHFATVTKELLSGLAEVDNSWGLDHGSWAVLNRIFPDAEIPVFQLSVDRKASAEDCFAIGRKLRALREQGVLIFGSGNVVHNLRKVDWQLDGGYPWAEKFDNYIKENILKRNFENVVHFEKAGESAALSVPMMDHFAPLLYVLGAANDTDQITVFNDACVLGGLSMTGYLLE